MISRPRGNECSLGTSGAVDKYSKGDSSWTWQGFASENGLQSECRLAVVERSSHLKIWGQSQIGNLPVP